jgi:hypothetical protein
MAMTLELVTKLPMKPSNFQLVLKLKSYLRSNGHHGWAVWSLKEDGWHFRYENINPALASDISHMMREYDNNETGDD